jgi:hypothetical protein
MTSATRILQQIEQGDPSAAEQLLPLMGWRTDKGNGRVA